MGKPKNWDDALYFGDTGAFFLVAYGASRRTERAEAYNENLRRQRYQQVATIFEPHVGLVPFEQALRQIDDYVSEEKGLSNAITILNDLLPSSRQLVSTDVKKPYGDLAQHGVKDWRFNTGTTEVMFSSLADGYRSFVGWITDLLLRIDRTTPQNQAFTEIAGTVIVDEIDLLLHPSWQRTVVETIATTFPNLQFLFSTHSPIVAATLEPQNIFVMDTDENGASVVRQYKEPIYGLTADQALTSSYFGLDTPRAPEMERELRRLSKAAETDYEAAREYLQLLRKGL